MAKLAGGKTPPPRPMTVTDAASAREDIKQYFGLVPEFIAAYPPEALPGAWTEMKSLEIAESALPSKYKSLISLAVASQIPCRYCIAADTQFAFEATPSGETDIEPPKRVPCAKPPRPR